MSAIHADDHLGLSFALAHRFCRRMGITCPHDREDAQQEAALALLRAARGFDDSRGDWANYASQTIRNSLVYWFNYLRPLRLRHAAKEATQKQVLQDIPSCTYDPDLGLQLTELRVAFSRMRDSDRALLSARYGMDGATEQTLQEIGDAENRSRQAVSAQEQRALARLRKAIKQN
jgi:RNA polymerase sigma factor (sigma-70 family)